ncbi:MAG: GNAT family N-acetyltransferase [Clostridia bacterium]|nr:GNAT family N-acetyltransferase [Clostridia bacterium]
MLYLEEINPGNWRLGLKVAKEQENYVASDFRMLARAYAYREYRSKAFVIYNDATPVGMAMYYDCDELSAYDFSQLFIDERYQGNGYGYAAAAQIVERMKADGKFRKIILCYIEGNEAARKLYEKIGFYHTGEVDDDEIIMQMDL